MPGFNLDPSLLPCLEEQVCNGGARAEKNRRARKERGKGEGAGKDRLEIFIVISNSVMV
jgi:hypothetical protein